MRAAGDGHAHAVLVGGGQGDLATAAGGQFWRAGDRFGGILHQVQQYLHQLVAVCPSWRQGGIVVLGDPQVGGKPGACQAAHVLQDAVDVDGAALDGLLAEHLHAVHQVADAVGLVADQHGRVGGTHDGGTELG